MLLLQNVTAVSQYIHYGYDAAGNRIKREIVLSANKNSRKNPQKAFMSESLSDKIIKIYPNPTKGILKIEITEWSETDIGTITLISANGSKLMSTPLIDGLTTIDITQNAPVIYLLHLNLNERTTTWKIIKE